MEVNRYLRKDKLSKSGYAPIQFAVCLNGKRIRLSSEEKCKPAHWNESSQKMNGKAPYADVINSKLNLWENVLFEIYHEFKRSGALLTVDILKSELFARVRKASAEEPAPDQEVVNFFWPDAVPGAAVMEEPQQSEFFRHFYAWVDYLKDKIQHHSGRVTSPGTIKGNNSTIKRFEEFEKYRGDAISFESIDKPFYSEFQKYMLEHLKQKPNNFGKHIKKLKSFLKWCDEEMGEELKINRKYLGYKVTAVYVGVDALTTREVQAIYRIDFNSPDVRKYILEHFPKTIHIDSPKVDTYAKELETVRDIFLMMCYTGLRISDMLKLRPDDIKGDIIVISATKTLNTCYIPVYDDGVFKPSEVIDRYYELQETCLPQIPDQVINRQLKHIQQLAGIKRMKLTTKIGRKTFVTLKIYQGVETRLIMQATGHKTETSFNAYVGTDTNELVMAYKRQSHKHDSYRVAKEGAIIE